MVTDPKLNAKAQRMLDAAISRYDREQRRARTYDWLVVHGLLAVVVLCVFAAGFVVGAIWQLNSGH